jgi:hypothetical protein
VADGTISFARVPANFVGTVALNSAKPVEREDAFARVMADNERKRNAA